MRQDEDVLKSAGEENVLIIMNPSGKRGRARHRLFRMRRRRNRAHQEEESWEA